VRFCPQCGNRTTHAPWGEQPCTCVRVVVVRFCALTGARLVVLASVPLRDEASALEHRDRWGGLDGVRPAGPAGREL
jgi:hypothetical protein